MSGGDVAAHVAAHEAASARLAALKDRLFALEQRKLELPRDISKIEDLEARRMLAGGVPDFGAIELLHAEASRVKLEIPIVRRSVELAALEAVATEREIAAAKMRARPLRMAGPSIVPER